MSKKHSLKSTLVGFIFSISKIIRALSKILQAFEILTRFLSRFYSDIFLLLSLAKIT